MHFQKGLTLIEILIVVVILGTLAAVLVVNLIPQSEKANQQIAKTQIGQIAQHLTLYQAEHRKLPPAGGGLSAMSADPAATYYLKPEQLIDPWGNPFIYRVPGSNGHPFDLISYGADGQPGGEHANADLSLNPTTTP